MSDEDSLEIKTILVGMSGTGKTNIINAMINKPFNAKEISTLTSSFVSKYVEIKQKKYRVELWDTAGQERYKSLTKIFIKDSKIVIFVYDITRKNSFEEVDYWVKTVKENLDGDDYIFGLIGNKKDLFMNEEVDEETGRGKAEEIGALFKLTSAKNETNAINQFIKELVEEYLRKNNGYVKKDDSRGQTIDYNSMDLSTGKKKTRFRGC
jgi:small GTP-binding protein